MTKTKKIEKPCNIGDKCFVISMKSNLIIESTVANLIYSVKDDEWTISAENPCGDVFLDLDKATAVREKRILVHKVAELLYRRQRELLPKFLGTDKVCSFGGVKTLEKHLDYKFNAMTFEELNKFYENNKRKPYTVYTVQKMIDKNHRDVLWYGGRVAEVAYKGYTFILGAYGDVRATLFSTESEDDILAEVKDKRNQGRFYEEMNSFIENDFVLKKAENDGRLVLENNNWFEVLIDGPDGYTHDLGWVTCSDNYDEALQEMIENMDDVINDIGKGSSDEHST